MTRLATMTYALLLSCVLAFAAAPAAHAQLLDDVTTDVGNAVGDVVDGGTGDGDSGGSITAPVDDVLKDDGENKSSDADDDGSSDTNLLDDITKTVEDTTDPVKDTADDGAKTIDEATGGSTGGYYDGFTGTVEKTVDGTGETVQKISSGDSDKRTRKSVKSGSGTSSRDADVFGKRFDAALQADQKRRATEAQQLRAKPAAVVEQPEENVVQQIGRVAAEAAEQMAFPLILLLMVGAFLVGQNRVDRRDPKLALAPVDLDADLLSFT